MKNIFDFGTSVCCLAALTILSTTALAEHASPRRVENFNSNWRFVRGAQTGAERADFDDSSWSVVQLPHDWAISGPYEPKGDHNTGKLPWRGEGWYRKQFVPPASDTGKRVYLDFDGVMAAPTVYVNGRRAGGWDYGYMSFRVDATDFIQFGTTNTVAVHADTRTHQSRWYPGAGIYRKVRMVVNQPIHVAQWGVSVTTPSVSDTAATVQVETTVENHTGGEKSVELETRLIDPKGKTVAKGTQPLRVAANTNAICATSFEVAKPQRWDVTNPRLYTAVSRILVDRKPMDTLETSFGIRAFEFTANDGFHLNGRRVQLNGVNLHHDQGPLGAAFFPRAMERQLEIMRDMGVNAIRTSHNPPAPELLDLCDRMGFVVWDEVFDKWDGTATRPRDVSMIEHGRKQIRPFVLRDRNHPCVVVWSAGNEIFDLEGGKFPNSPDLLRQMTSFFKDLDKTRPVALAHCVADSPKSALDDALDVTGWNYGRRYALSREQRPQLPIVYSESASAFSTRGHYELPHPIKKDDFPVSLRISSYDHNSASYSDLADTEFALMEQDRFVAGEFVWTGFDYIGEPAPFIAQGWGAFSKRKITREEESRISSFGIVDWVGLPKDRFYLYRSHWATERKTVHLLPHWNWPERVGQTVPVYVYTSGDSAELFINGKSLGKKSKDPQSKQVLDRYRLRWEDAVYQPGEIKTIAYSKGRKLGEAVVRTAGEPAKLRLTPDRKSLRATGEDLSYLLVEAVDAAGVSCPLAMNEVKFKIQGPAAIAGVGNGDHHYPAEFVADHVALFYGKAILVVRTREAKTGTIRVEAESAGLAPARTTLRSQTK